MTNHLERSSWALKDGTITLSQKEVEMHQCSFCAQEIFGMCVYVNKTEIKCSFTGEITDLAGSIVSPH